MNGFAKLLMTLGALIFSAGLAVYLASKIGLPFGKLPGDISYVGRNFKFFAPITSMILVSLLLTIILNILARIKGN